MGRWLRAKQHQTAGKTFCDLQKYRQINDMSDWKLGLNDDDDDGRHLPKKCQHAKGKPMHMPDTE